MDGPIRPMHCPRRCSVVPCLFSCGRAFVSAWEGADCCAALELSINLLLRRIGFSVAPNNAMPRRLARGHGSVLFHTTALADESPRGNQTPSSPLVRDCQPSGRRQKWLGIFCMERAFCGLAGSRAGKAPSESSIAGALSLRRDHFSTIAKGLDEICRPRKHGL
jgi:hypothetical protein